LCVHVRPDRSERIVPVDAKRFSWEQRYLHLVPGHLRVVTMHRECVPLQLAWAMTIDKSIGLTIPAVVLDIGSLLGRPPTPGLGKVALSRTARFDDLCVVNYNEAAARRVFVDRKGSLPLRRHMARSRCRCTVTWPARQIPPT
jgi:hypothetical protein